jgi:YfiH family protein
MTTSPALPLVRSRLLSQFPAIDAAMSTRQGAERGAPFGFNLGFAVGDDEARVEEHLLRFLARLDVAPDEVAFMEQVHGAEVAVVEEAGVHSGTDAVITRMPRLALAARTADCVPVLVYAPAARTIAAIHAGWRGASERIVGRTIALMHTECGAVPAEMVAFVGPSARGCCYEVSPDIAALFPASVVTERDGRNPLLDLQEAVVHHLRDAGLTGENIDVDRTCTICSPSLHHSHRRDGARAGRMLSVIVLRDEEPSL